MTYNELKDHFKLKFDVYSGYFNNDRLNKILNNAYYRVVNRVYRDFHRGHKNLSELRGLIKEENNDVFDDYKVNITPTSGFGELTNFLYPISATLGYEYNDSLRSSKATFENEGFIDDGSIFDQPTLRNPKATVRSENINFYPEIKYKYFVIRFIRVPDLIDVSDTVTEPLVSEFMQYKIIEEAGLIASQIVGDPNRYEYLQNEIRNNP